MRRLQRYKGYVMEALKSKPDFENTGKSKKSLKVLAKGIWLSLSPDSEWWGQMEEDMGRAGGNFCTSSGEADQ